MTDSKSEIKWFYRCGLLLLAGGAGWVVVQPEYNIAHWVPHSLMRTLGMPYAQMLWLESNADKLLHPLLGCLLTLGLWKSSIPLLSWPRYRPCLTLAILMLAAELIQWQIGRGFELADLLLGLMGSLAATLFIKYEPQSV